MAEADPYTLPARYRELQAQATALAESIASRAEIADNADHVDAPMRESLARSGIASVVVPSEYGGRFEKVDSLAVTVIREVFAGVSTHLDSLFAMQGIGSYPLTIGGSDATRTRWLPAVARCEAIAALALTEPHVGSDLKSITTTISTDGPSLVVSGSKSFITNAGDADFYIVLGRENAEYSLVLVPSDQIGVSVTHPSQIIAPHVIGDVEFDDVRVSRDHRVGGAGAGFPLVLATLATFRVSVAGAAIGLAQAALNEALRHTTARSQFGKPLAQLGAVSQSLALSWTEIEMARSFTYAAAAAAARDPLGSLHLSSMAKVAATEISGRVVDRSVQCMGRFGLVQGSLIERLYREARPMRIYEGSTEVILDSLARQLIKRSNSPN